MLSGGSAIRQLLRASCARSWRIARLSRWHDACSMSSHDVPGLDWKKRSSLDPQTVRNPLRTFRPRHPSHPSLSAWPNGNSVENVRSWITSIDFFPPRPREINGSNSIRETRLFKNLHTIDTKKLKEKKKKKKNRKGSSILTRIQLPQSLHKHI